MEKIHVVKTSFNKIFKGTIDHLDNIERLYIHVNRLVIHVTHFTKWYLLNCSEDIQVTLDKDSFKVMLLLMNSTQTLNTSKITPTQLLIQHFRPFIIEYKQLINYNYSKLTNIDQVLTYHATLLATNFCVNIQEQFTKKIRTFLTVLIVKRTLSGLGNERKNELRPHLQEMVRDVREAIFTNSLIDLPEEYHEFVNTILDYLQLPERVDVTKGFPYDVVVQPLAYSKSYLRLSKLFESNGLNQFNFTPLSTSTIPRHVTIDSTTLATFVLEQKKPQSFLDDTQKLPLWDQVFKLKNKAFQSRKHDNTKFTGMIKTDGVSVSVIVGPQTTKGPGRKRKKIVESESYLQDATMDQIKHSKVFIDPNKRDLLYCLGSNEKKLRYTQSQRDHETKSRKYRNIRNELRNDAEIDGQPYDVAAAPKKTLDVNGFNIYLRFFFATFTEKEEVYNNKIFRKLRFNTYVNIHKSEAKFINRFIKVYGKETTVFIGDWDSGGVTLPGQVTTKGVGFRKMFRKHGFEVLLVNEYKTSKTCPKCSGELSSFLKRNSPKPWKRETEVTVHGLLRCQSENCQQQCGGNSRLWNRDDVATLNIKAIVVETIENGGERPARFKRQRV